MSKVKNKQASDKQITAEMLLRESEHSREKQGAPIKQVVQDMEELAEVQLRKRKQFEDAVRRNRTAVGAWLKYAAWEESQNEMERARSVYERSLDFEPRNQTLWLKYAEMEMRHKNVNRARNILDRVVAILPRVDLFWYKYTYMEELLDNVDGARGVFERWMEWEPTEEAWVAFIKFEKRYNQVDRAREIFKRFVTVFPQPKNWIKWAKFEEENGFVDTCRQIYEQCIESLGKDFVDQNVYISFAKFETRHKEIDRARVIYKFALDRLPEGQKENLFNVFTQFEKQYGGRDGAEAIILSKRRVKYEDQLSAQPYDYDIWFDYVRLEESNGNADKIREIYERAIAQVPLVDEKRYWKRYIYLWLFYAVWEEAEANNPERAKQVYENCLVLLKPKPFSSAKVWLLFAKFLIRQKDLKSARKLLGQALGSSAKEKLFKGYIELELSLREFDRVRQLYQKYLEWNPANCYAWVKFSELESMLGDTDRARAIFEIGAGQGALDMPEVLWKAYIDFETAEMEWSNARALYKRLIALTGHVKVYISLAKFELIAMDTDDEQERVKNARRTFSEVNDILRKESSKEERVLLLDAWLVFEKQHGQESDVKAVEDKMPRPVKKRRRLEDENGVPSGWEEYYDYIFPDNEEEKPNFKLLALAHQWKMKAAQMEDEESEEEEDDDDDKQ